MAKETDKLKMVDIKFDDRFLESLWSGEKTSTIRGKKKGDPGDTFLVEYGDLIMDGFARFEFQYDEEKWQSSRMKDIGVGGIYCHEVIE